MEEFERENGRRDSGDEREHFSRGLADTGASG